MGHPGAKFFPQPLTGGAKKEKRTKKERKAEGLWKLPPLWKKAKRCAAFSRSGLDKTERTNVLGFIHNFTQAR